MSGSEHDPKFQDLHAVLFYGSEGAGMFERALSLSNDWLCADPREGRACGACGTCRSFIAGRMVDFMHYKPWGPSNILKIDSIRPPGKGKKPDDEAPRPNLIEFFRVPPLMARHKVALFERAERFNKDASNALLKTLEEPPHYAKVVLVTAEYSRLLPTVRSRCVSVSCGYEPPEADEMSRVFGGSPGLHAKVESHRAAYERLWGILQSSLEAPAGGGLMLAEQTREASEAVAHALKLNARGGHTETLRCVAEWLVHARPDRPELAQMAVEAHRRVVGNVNAGPVYDALWAHITAR